MTVTEFSTDHSWVLFVHLIVDYILAVSLEVNNPKEHVGTVPYGHGSEDPLP